MSELSRIQAQKGGVEWSGCQDESAQHRIRPSCAVCARVALEVASLPIVVEKVQGYRCTISLMIALVHLVEQLTLTRGKAQRLESNHALAVEQQRGAHRHHHHRRGIRNNS